MTSIYIRSAACISPKTTGEPDYKAFIDPKALRRMSRIIRMGVAAARACLQEASLATPDAIVTGTGYGCLEDTGLFLTSMLLIVRLMPVISMFEMRGLVRRQP